MAEVVVMPAAGNTVESCLLATWRVAVNDQVTATTVLADIETDKSTMEVPVGVAGTVLALLADEGDDVPVKQPIAIIGSPGEDISTLLTTPPAPAKPAVPLQASTAPEGLAVPTPPPAPTPPPQPAPAAGAVSPRARGLAEALGVDVAMITGTGPNGRVTARDVQAAAPFTTVGARLVAAEADVAQAGTGLGGRLTRADIATAAAPPVGEFTETRLTGVRKLIADRMMESLAASAQLTYTATAPAANLLAMRARFKTSDSGLGYARVTIGDLVGFAAVRALAKHAIVNSLLVDGVIRTYAEVHLGIAVDTPRGLLVPTVRQASQMTLLEFSTLRAELAEQASAGSINPDLLQGATFTVTNLGAYGIESFTPVLNLPQVAILGVDAIRPHALVNPDGSLGAEHRIGFSLTADHRVIDGADAARYLQDLCAAIADIDLFVMG